MKPEVSVVIVAYKDMESVAECIKTIGASAEIEVIVVNNSHQNRGFGAGCNLGASVANGETLLFLNPDTLALTQAILALNKVLEDKSIGMVGPALLNEEGKIVLSACEQPKKRNFWWVYSFLNRLFPGSTISQRFWYGFRPPQQRREVEVISGAAIAIKKRVFEKVGGFDERFFLYWEEYDLARRIWASGLRVVYEPAIKVVHIGGTSTPSQKERVMRWFRESRFYFMRKHFGTVYALMVEAFLSASEHWQLVLSLLGVGLLSYQADTVVTIAAIIMATMVYNELVIWMKKINAAFAGLIVGLLVLIKPIVAEYVLWLGVGWIIIDLVSRLSRWRWLYVLASVMGVLCSRW